MKIIEKEGNLELDEVLSRPLFAHLSTHDEKGVYDSPLWFFWKNNFIWFIGDKENNSFPKRLKRFPECSLGIVDFDLKIGRVNHIGLRGKAEITEMDVEVVRKILSKYLGDDDSKWDSKRFGSNIAAWSHRYDLIRFIPETVVIRDQSYSVKFSQEKL